VSTNKIQYVPPTRTHAERCPVCNGAGTLPVTDLEGYPVTNTGGPMTKPCHGCYGKGWVVVP
jgi:DnaJ-class molecular chaperone